MRFSHGRPAARAAISVTVLQCLLTLCLAFTVSCSPGKATKEGNAAPDFSLLSLDGREVTLTEFRGKVVILDFWATWCKPCRLELPHFIELYGEYRDRGVEIIGISLDRLGNREVAAFVTEWKIPYTIVIGTTDVSNSYGGISGIPTTFVIDKKGDIYRKYIGYRKKEVFERDILKLLE